MELLNLHLTGDMHAVTAAHNLLTAMVDNSLHHQNLSNVLYSGDFSRFSTLGENIIVGPGNMSPQQLQGAWMNSAPHRANVLNRNYNVVGIGVFWGPDGRVWAVVDFGAV